MDSFNEPCSWSAIAFSTCSSAGVSVAEASECMDLGGLIVLAESLVVVDTAVLERCNGGDITGRPRVTSSDDLPTSADVDGRTGCEKGERSGPKSSVLSLLFSVDGRAKLPAELEGRDGGEGGAWPFTDIVGCSHWLASGACPSGPDLWRDFPLGRANLE